MLECVLRKARSRQTCVKYSDFSADTVSNSSHNNHSSYCQWHVEIKETLEYTLGEYRPVVNYCRYIEKWFVHSLDVKERSLILVEEIWLLFRGSSKHCATLLTIFTLQTVSSFKELRRKKMFLECRKMHEWKPELFWYLRK